MGACTVPDEKLFEQSHFIIIRAKCVLADIRRCL